MWQIFGLSLSKNKDNTFFGRVLLSLIYIKLYQCGCFSLFSQYSNQGPSKKIFFYFCPKSNQRPTKNGVLTMFALILTKALPKMIFLLYFCPYSTQQNVVFSILFLFSPKPKRCFFSLYFCPYSNKRPTKKGVFLYLCPYSNQGPTIKCFSSMFALILTKVLPESVFFPYFCPYFHQNHTKKGVFLYLCANSNLTLTKRMHSLFLALTIT